VVLSVRACEDDVHGRSFVSRTHSVNCQPDGTNDRSGGSSKASLRPLPGASIATCNAMPAPKECPATRADPKPPGVTNAMQSPPPPCIGTPATACESPA